MPSACPRHDRGRADFPFSAGGAFDENLFVFFAQGSCPLCRTCGTIILERYCTAAAAPRRPAESRRLRPAGQTAPPGRFRRPEAACAGRSPAALRAVLPLHPPKTCPKGVLPMLQLILGEAGTGKTTETLRRIRASAARQTSFSPRHGQGQGSAHPAGHGSAAPPAPETHRK